MTTAFGELRTTHQQNMVLADVEHKPNLYELWQALHTGMGFATANVGYAHRHVICCPGGDYCALANAKSIPGCRGNPARSFDDMDYVYDLGQYGI